MSIGSLLQKEIENEFENLQCMDAGTEEYKVTVDGLTKLVDRAIEIDKLNNERKEKMEIREREETLQRTQIKEERIDRWVKNGIAIAGILIPSVITVWGTYRTLKFEEEGTVTTIMGRGFINKLLPKK